MEGGAQAVTCYQMQGASGDLLCCPCGTRVALIASGEPRLHHCRIFSVPPCTPAAPDPPPNVEPLALPPCTLPRPCTCTLYTPSALPPIYLFATPPSIPPSLL